MPTQLEILRKSRDRVVAKRGADDAFAKSLEEKIAAAEKTEAASLPLQMRPTSHQPTGLVIQMREFHEGTE